MADLVDLGFKKEVISEAIVSTYNPDGSPNAAPMGIKSLDPQKIALNVFNTSATCQNLIERKCAVINLTKNIDVFYKTTFKEANPTGKVPDEWFTPAETIEAPKLRFADASVEVSVNTITKGSERTVFTCKVERLIAAEKFPQVYCRAMPLTLEAITHATRVKAFLKQPEKQKEAAKLIETIQSCAAIVSRVAPNSTYTDVLDDLLQRINSRGPKI